MRSARGLFLKIPRTRMLTQVLTEVAPPGITKCILSFRVECTLQKHICEEHGQPVQMCPQCDHRTYTRAGTSPAKPSFGMTPTIELSCVVFFRSTCVKYTGTRCRCVHSVTTEHTPGRIWRNTSGRTILLNASNVNTAPRCTNVERIVPHMRLDMRAR